MRARSGGETGKKEKGVNRSIQRNHNGSNRVNKENKGAICNMLFSLFH